MSWHFHELEPGRFDFQGATDPRRDLVGFIELVGSMGLWLVLRPGPYIYAEWPNSGIPDRLVQYHRLHPQFLTEAERYMAAVFEAFAPYLATRGGPVVLVQADNEPDPWADIYASQLGLGPEPGSFHAFLRQRYAGDLHALNSAWSTDLGQFEEARAVMAPLRDADMPRYLDVVRFFHHYAAEITRWAADTYRRLGVDVPIYTNAYAGFEVQHWPQMQRHVAFLGPDIYPTAELHQDAREHRRMLEHVRFARTHSPLPYIPEFEAGIWQGWHERVGVLLPHHYRLICVSALLAGVAGWGWYMLVNRDNWMMSPIDELGRPRPDLAPEFAEIVRVFREMDPPSLEKLTDTAVAVDVLDLAAGLLDERLLDALYAADIDYEFFDMESGNIHKRLLLCAATVLSESSEKRLLDYVDAGGTLVLFSDALHLKSPDGVLTTAGYPRRLRVELGASPITCSPDLFGWFAEVPGEPIWAERVANAPRSQQGLRLHDELPVGERYIVGYRERRGAGWIVQLGVPPTAELLVGLHRWLGLGLPSHSDLPQVSTALFRHANGQRFLVAVNNGQEPRHARVVLDEPARFAMDLFSRESQEISEGAGSVVVVVLPRKSGTVLRLWSS